MLSHRLQLAPWSTISIENVATNLQPHHTGLEYTLLMTPLRNLLQARPRPLSYLRYTVFRSFGLRTMATTNSNSTAPNATTNTVTSSSPTEQASEQPLPLPEPDANSKAVVLDVGSELGVKLDHLGPMVVNRDGTLSRVANWETMADIERQNTLRILGKRNQLRMATLRAEEDEKTAR